MRMSCIPFALFTLALGCPSEKSRIDPDLDTDGWHSPRDCNDADPTVHPEADETCDGVDQDCDSVVDEDPTDGSIFYADEDGDGYGADPPIVLCDAREGLTTVADDCDDVHADVHPGAMETWYDGIDQDCAGDSDHDADKDGFDSQFWGGDDCDDTQSDVHPGAEETWYDGVDQDCEGDDDLDADADGHRHADMGGNDCDDQDATAYPGAEEIWYDDIDQDCSGTHDGDSDLDGHDAASVGGDDCDDANARVHPGAYEICNGVDDNCDNVDDESCHVDTGAAATRWVGGAIATQLGFDAAFVPDMDGDGIDDLIVGEPDYQSKAGVTPAVYIFSGGVLGDVQTTANLATFGTTESSDFLGLSVASADVTGDGISDYIMTSRTYPPDFHGRTWIVEGPESGGIILEAHARTVLDGQVYYDGVGIDLQTVGDLDGNGLTDFVVGAFSGEDVTGSIYVIPSPPPIGAHPIANVGHRIDGEAAGDIGAFSNGAGDVNGDGLDDLVVISSYARNTFGALYLVHGPADAISNLSSSDAILTGPTQSQYFGISASGAGDVDGDGYADIVAGAPYESGGATFGGGAYLVFGPITGESMITNVAGATLLGDVDMMGAGVEVSDAGDMNGDGFDDILLSKDYRDHGGVWLVLGPTSGTSLLSEADRYIGGRGAEMLGYHLTSGGDMDLDGRSDILISAMSSYPNQRGEGEVLLFTASELGL